jgi:hypothetical protein
MEDIGGDLDSPQNPAVSSGFQLRKSAAHKILFLSASRIPQGKTAATACACSGFAVIRLSDKQTSPDRPHLRYPDLCMDTERASLVRIAELSQAVQPAPPYTFSPFIGT